MLCSTLASLHLAPEPGTLWPLWHKEVTRGDTDIRHQGLNMDGDKNGGQNGQGPGTAKPDPQEANNSYSKGSLKSEMDRII